MFNKDAIKQAMAEESAIITEQGNFAIFSSYKFGSRTNLRAKSIWYVFSKETLGQSEEEIKAFAQGESASLEESKNRAMEALKRLEGSGDPKLSSVVWDLLVKGAS
jgi:hypothetical protein